MHEVTGRLVTNHTIHCTNEQATALEIQKLSDAIVDFYTSSDQKPQSLFVSLDGDLGAGKTTAIRYLLKAMGYAGKVRSPTYSLIEEHVVGLPNQEILHVFHFDLYRMQTPQEWVEAGLLEHFTRSDHSTMCMIEWPKKAKHTLPAMDLAINLTHPNGNQAEFTRTVDMTALTAKGETILELITQ